MTDIEELLIRAEIEKQRAVEELKTRLMYSMAIEFEDFESIKDKPMTIELGESLRNQIKIIFRKIRALQ